MSIAKDAGKNECFNKGESIILHCVKKLIKVINISTQKTQGQQLKIITMGSRFQFSDQRIKINNCLNRTFNPSCNRNAFWILLSPSTLLLYFFSVLSPCWVILSTPLPISHRCCHTGIYVLSMSSVTHLQKNTFLMFETFN